MSTTTRIIRDYLEAVHGGGGGLDRARTLLADDLSYDDPMMSAADADDLVARIEAMAGGREGQPATRIADVVGDGEVGAALTHFELPGGPSIPFTQWFRVEDGRIASIRVIYDPRPFLAAVRVGADGRPGVVEGGGAPPSGTPAEGRSLTAPVTDRVIALDARLPIAPAEAFRWFTENDRLEAWLAEEADVSPHVGGSYQLYWDPETPSDDSTIGCRITALVRDRLLAFQWRSPKQYKPFANAADPLTHVVVSFFPEDEGTKVHLLHSGWRSAPEWEEARAWQERAWRVALQRLAVAAPGARRP